MLLETAITVISLGVQIPNFEHYQATRDVYKMVATTSMPANNESREAPFAGGGVIPTTFIGNTMPTITTWGMVLQTFAPVNTLHIAFDKAEIKREIGDYLLSMAKGVLIEMKYPSVDVRPSLVSDPEENAVYLTLCLHINATFEESLALDSKLTKELISREINMPENLSFAVYDIG